MAYGQSMARGYVNAREVREGVRHEWAAYDREVARVIHERARGCDGVTLKGRMCRRKAEVSYRLHTGRVVGYCTQHDRGAGVNSMLKPFPWEIDSTV